MTVSAAAAAKTELDDGAAPPQHLRALARADEVRLARAALKRSIAAREVDVATVIAEVPWEATVLLA